MEIGGRPRPCTPLPSSPGSIHRHVKIHTTPHTLKHTLVITSNYPNHSLLVTLTPAEALYPVINAHNDALIWSALKRTDFIPQIYSSYQVFFQHAAWDIRSLNWLFFLHLLSKSSSESLSTNTRERLTSSRRARRSVYLSVASDASSFKSSPYMQRKKNPLRPTQRPANTFFPLQSLITCAPSVICT